MRAGRGVGAGSVAAAPAAACIGNDLTLAFSTRPPALCSFAFLLSSFHLAWPAEFRGERHCDGGLTNFIPLAPGTVGVRVCCFPSQQLSPVYRIGISPDSFEPWGYTLRQTVQWAFEPADEAIVAALIDKGEGLGLGAGEQQGVMELCCFVCCWLPWCRWLRPCCIHMICVCLPRVDCFQTFSC